MSRSLDTLQSKISQVASRCRDLHADNLALRSQLAAVARERDAMREKLDAACTRLERVVEQLPEA